MTQPAFIAGMITVAVAIVFYGVWAMRQEGSRKDAMKGRLSGETMSEQGGEVQKPGESVIRDIKFSDIPFLDAVLGGAALGGLLRLWLLQARVKWSPGSVLLVSALTSCIGFFGSYLATERILVSTIIGLVGLMLPLGVVNHKRHKRFKAFARQLPDALQMMKNSLQAGHTLDKAMNVISEEMPDPIALEFRETVEELHLGAPVKRAMENFGSRVVDENLKIFVAALLVQREVGGNLNELLGNLAGTIRERFRMEQEVKSLTAEGRISGYVIGVLPVALAIIISVMQPDYLKPLFETETGHMLLKGSVCLEIIGFYFINKASKVNF
jgi:tight adherence protein B